MHTNISNYIQVLETIYIVKRMSKQIKDEPEQRDQRPEEIKQQERPLARLLRSYDIQSLPIQPVNFQSLNTKQWPLNNPQIMRIGFDYYQSAERRRFQLMCPGMSQHKIQFSINHSWNSLNNQQKKIFCYQGERQFFSDQEMDLLPRIRQKIYKRFFERQILQKNQQQKRQQKQEEVHQIHKPVVEVEENRVPLTEINQSASSNSIQAAVSNSLSTCIANAELNCPQIEDPKQKFILVECNNIQLNEQEIQKLTNVLIEAKNQSPTKQYETIAIIQEDAEPAITETKEIVGEQVEKVPQTDTQIVIRPNDYKEEKDALGISQKPENEC